MQANRHPGEIYQSGIKTVGNVFTALYGATYSKQCMEKRDMSWHSIVSCRSVLRFFLLLCCFFCCYCATVFVVAVRRIGKISSLLQLFPLYTVYGVRRQVARSILYIFYVLGSVHLVRYMPWYNSMRLSPSVGFLEEVAFFSQGAVMEYRPA